MIRPNAAAFCWCLTEHIAGIKRTRCLWFAESRSVNVPPDELLDDTYPTSPSKKDVRIFIQRRQLLTQIRKAALSVAASTGLRKHGLPTLLLQPLAESNESVHIVGHAFSVRAAVIRVEVLVNVEDQVVCSPVVIFDILKRGTRAILDEVRC